jgi:hypothetical protein
MEGVGRSQTHPVIRIDLCFGSDILGEIRAEYEVGPPRNTAYVCRGSMKHE